MKKSTAAALLCAAAVLILLLSAAVCLTRYRDKLAAEVATLQSEADEALQTLHELATEQNAEETEAEEFRIIWSGDSRTVGMQKAMKNEDIYIGASGEGYQWLHDTGLARVAEAIAQYPAAPVVFNFGVNDYDNLSRYLTLYESLMQDYPKTQFYFLAVYPVDDEVCKYITNAEICDFNAHLHDLSPETYLDSYTWLMENQAKTTDGIHYSEEDYRKLYTFAAELILQKMEETAL